jgi:hypothetical protein
MTPITVLSSNNAEIGQYNDEYVVFRLKVGVYYFLGFVIRPHQILLTHGLTVPRGLD